MTRPALPSPYAAEGFYEAALAKGQHRDIVGGRWDETTDIAIPLIDAQGLRTDDHLLDIGAGCLRFGRILAARLPAGQYWATDASRALMLRGWEQELDDATRARLSPDHLVEDATFAFPGIPDTITFALAFAVFTHLPLDRLSTALANLRRFPALRRRISCTAAQGGGRHADHDRRHRRRGRLSD